MFAAFRGNVARCLSQRAGFALQLEHRPPRPSMADTTFQVAKDLTPAIPGVSRGRQSPGMVRTAFEQSFSSSRVRQWFRSRLFYCFANRQLVFPQQVALRRFRLSFVCFLLSSAGCKALLRRKLRGLAAQFLFLLVRDLVLSLQSVLQKHVTAPTQRTVLRCSPLFFALLWPVNPSHRSNTADGSIELPSFQFFAKQEELLSVPARPGCVSSVANLLL